MDNIYSLPSTCLDFLSDERFIEYALTQRTSLHNEWEEYLAVHPSARPEFDKAMRLVQHIKLNSERMPDGDFVLLHERIKQSYHTAVEHRRKQRLLYYVTAACAAVLLLILPLSLYLYNKNGKQAEQQISKSMIVGQNLEAENITLFTSSTRKTFTEDVNLQVKNNGQTVVKESNGSETIVETPSDEAPNRLVVPYGKRSFVTLSDGTKVWVNSGSVLEFPSHFAKQKREIRVTGEIYIEVAPDKQKPFHVHTDKLDVRVYGTRFNVSSYADSTPPSVVLVEGSISLRTDADDEGKEHFLQPNDKVTYTNRLLVREQVDPSIYTAWKEGYLILDHTPIDDVLQRIGRYYNLTFNLGDNLDLQSRTCTGKICLSPNLDNVMRTISLLSGTEYSREDNSIYIRIHP
jgi:ferric-dicitrate binding protein FerR (iron transport regulator)